MLFRNHCLLEVATAFRNDRGVYIYYENSRHLQIYCDQIFDASMDQEGKSIIIGHIFRLIPYKLVKPAYKLVFLTLKHLLQGFMKT